jgi:hypothetical protein
MNSQTPTSEQELSLSSVGAQIVERLARIEERMITKNQAAGILFALLLVGIPGSISIWSTVRTTSANTATLQQSVATAGATQRSLDQGQITSLRESITAVDTKVEKEKDERDRLLSAIAQNYSRLGSVRSTVDEIAENVNRPDPPAPKKLRWYQR